MKRLTSFVLVVFISLILADLCIAQQARETVDSVVVARIKDEAMNRSHIMDLMSTLCDVYGPRLTGSPAFKRAADWARQTLESWGLSDSHLEAWGPFGKGWALRRYSANVHGQQSFPLISYPKAWCAGTNGGVTSDIVYLEGGTDSAVEAYHGKVKGKFVLISDPREIAPPFEPMADRKSDSLLLQLANAGMPRERGGRRFEMSPEQRSRSLLLFKKLNLCQTEGAAGILTISGGDGGNVFVQGAIVPLHPDTPFARRMNAYDPKAPKLVPQIVVGAEHYNRLVRMIHKGERPKLEMNLDVDFFKEDSSYNIVAEIPGSDLKDQVVMIGGHFDSWHGGTGATDNATGTSVCMEAMRILKLLDLHPRRTIRIGLWGGEEEGLLGSRAYVSQHLGQRTSTVPGMGEINLKPDAEKFSVYFNHDNGTGRIRGVYMEGNDAARPIFRAWLEPFAEFGASTLSLRRTGGTDHQSFGAIGLPAFQFIQDDIDYDTRTHHSTMDLYERAQEKDLKEAAAIVAAFAYDAAMRNDIFPRRPLQAQPGGVQ